MATTTIYSQEDGFARYTTGVTQTNWDTVHDASAGASDADSENPTSLSVFKSVVVFLGTRYNISRAFLAFDVSSITSAPDSVTLNLYVTAKSGNFGIWALKSFHGDSIDHNDYNQICDGGCGSGWARTDSEVTAYGDSRLDYSLMNTSQYNSITLNSTAISDIVSNDTLYVALVDHHDYYDQSGTSAGSVTISGQATSGTSQDPYLELTTADPAVQGKILLSSGKVTLSSGKITF